MNEIKIIKKYIYVFVILYLYFIMTEETLTSINEERKKDIFRLKYKNDIQDRKKD